MANLSDSFQMFFGPMSNAQRTMFAGLVLSIVLFLSYLFYWALKPEYTLLFGSMQPDAAHGVIEDLEQHGVKYRLDNSGRSIYVPSDQVHELRLRMASSGVVRSDVKGYELFDENALGMTDFMQQVNKKRALEGELARSINSLEQVEFSRIHLVLPERSPFQQSAVQASASVILNIKRGSSLRNEQVEGITSLIAGSVEGLDKDAVVVLDQTGNRLTEGLSSSSDFTSGSLQIQLRQGVESYLADRAQTMLDRALGPGNSLLRVSVEHDFDRLIRESDLIDPDSRTIISEERRSGQTTDESSQQVPFDDFTPIDRRGETVVISNRSDESIVQTRNYEVNKTREIYEKSQGEIKRITASVLLNHKQVAEENEDGMMIISHIPYTDAEVNEFREIVRLALGIQPARGDELSVTQLQFFDPLAHDLQGLYMQQPLPWYDVIRWSVIAVTFFAIIALIFSIRKQMKAGETGLLATMPNYNMQNIPVSVYEENGGGDSDDGPDEDFIDKKLSGKAKKQLKEKTYVMEEIKDFVELKPLEAAQVVKALMTSDT